MDEPATAPESIAQLCLQCFQKFNDLKSAAAGRSSSKNAALPEGFSISTFLDVFARFRIWTGNIGALQRGKSSLDHRLQHTDLRKEVTRLLRQTIAALNDGTPNHSEVRSRELDFVDIVAVISFVNGDREQQTWYEGEGIATAYSDSDDDSGSAFSSDLDPTETRSGIFTPEEKDPRLLTECSQLAIILNDLIKSLLRLSLVIQRSSRRGKFVRSSRDKPYNLMYFTHWSLFLLLPRIRSSLNVLEKPTHSADNGWHIEEITMKGSHILMVLSWIRLITYKISRQPHALTSLRMSPILRDRPTNLQ